MKKDINMELFQKYFYFSRASLILKSLYNINDKERNNAFVDIIKSELSNLKNLVEKMSEDEIKIENLYKVVAFVEKTLIIKIKKDKD